MFSTALKPKGDITDIPPTYLPQEYIWSNFVKVFTEIEFGTYMKNTIIIALATMVIGLIASIPAGYYVARHYFRGRTLFYLLFSSLRCSPPQPCSSVSTERCRS